MDKRLKLFCVLVSAFLDFGIVFVFGAMLPAIMDTFEEDRTAAVTVQTLLIGITNGLGIVSGALVSRFGVRKVALIGAFLVPSGFIGAFFATSVWVLYISISCVAGFGVSLVYVGCVSVVAQDLSKSRRSLLLSLLSSTAGMAFVMEALLNAYSLSGTLLLLGGVLLHTIPAALIFTHEQNIEHENNKGKEALSKDETNEPLKQQVCSFVYKLISVLFVVVMLTTGLVLAVCNVSTSMVLDIIEWKGFDRKDGLYAFIPFNIANFCSRLSPGIIDSIKHTDKVTMAIVFAVCGVIGQSLMLYSSSYVFFLTSFGFVGSCLGGIILTGGILSVEIVGPQNAGFGFGCLLTAAGIITSIFGPMFGHVRDVTGSYATVLVALVVLDAAVVVSLLFTRFLRAINSSARTTNTIEGAK